MIDFTCRCGRHRFSLPESAAGDVVQCPACHLLRDVPTLSDLQSLDSDGMFEISAAPDQTESTEHRLADVKRAFAKSKYDEDGEEIDLIPTIDDLLKVGTDAQLTTGRNMEMDRPQYDPFTGALVRPMMLEDEVNPKPVQLLSSDELAPKLIGYARTDLDRKLEIGDIPKVLTRPINLLVMFFILLWHFALQPINMMLAGGIFIIAPVWIICVGLLIGHYANTVEDIGPMDRDELPRPLRDLSFLEDLWKPFTNAAGALMLCYLPLTFANAFDANSWILLAVGALGTVLFPAVFLTAVTSGSTPNLRPDRVWSVMRVLGTHYFMLIALLCAALAPYMLGLWRLSFDTVLLLLKASTAKQFNSRVPWWFTGWVAYPMLIAGIYCMNWFCWALGLAYRSHHEQFAWVFQKHVPVRMKERLTRREERAAKRPSRWHGK